MRFLIAASLVLLTVSPAAAQDHVRINMHGPSYHFSDFPWENSTWGGGLEMGGHIGAVWIAGMGGVYDNSMGHLTMYLGALVQRKITGPFGVGFSLLAATGYDHEYCDTETDCRRYAQAAPVVLIPMPGVTVGERVQLRLGGFPAMGGILHLMISVRP